MIYWFDPSFKLISCKEPGRAGATSKFLRLVYDEERRLKFLVLNKFSLTFFVTNPNGLMTVL